jgi:hypothetical protein
MTTRPDYTSQTKALLTQIGTCLQAPDHCLLSEVFGIYCRVVIIFSREAYSQHLALSFAVAMATALGLPIPPGTPQPGWLAKDALLRSLNGCIRRCSRSIKFAKRPNATSCLVSLRLAAERLRYLDTYR